MVEPENSTAVVFHTAHFVIAGRVALVPGARLTDFIRESSDFIAVVDAVLSHPEGTEFKRLPFLDLRKEAIEIAYPAA